MRQPSSHFPKILFVNDYPPDSLTLSNTARQLLSGYPSQRLSSWYCRWARIRGLSEIQPATVDCFRLPNRLEPARRMTGLKCSVLEWLWVPLAAGHLKKVIAREQPDLIWVLLFG